MTEDNLSLKFFNLLKEHELHTFFIDEHKTVEWISEYANAILNENKNQNITRITDFSDFVDLNIRDCLELNKHIPTAGTIVDLGSGAGIPGLLLAGIDFFSNKASTTRRWVLVESETRKCEFLNDIIQKSELTNVEVINSRIEDICMRLDNIEPVFVSRALAKVDKIETWLTKCSTWNILFLLKSKGWKDEWNNYETLSRKSPKKFKLNQEFVSEYFTAREGKYRNIVKLKK